jgi:hypothetical protein
MDMDLILARRLVWDALRLSVPRGVLSEDENVTLSDLGLATPDRRDAFKSALVNLILKAGYKIDPDVIPASADDTPIRIMLELPGQSTKDNDP